MVPWKVTLGCAIPLTSLPFEIYREEKKKAIRGLVLSRETKPPGPLFACKASRAVALKQYTTCLKFGSVKETRFDPENDTIFFYNTTVNHLQPLPGYLDTFESLIKARINFIDMFSEVRNLAICGFDMDVGSACHGKMTWLISRFQSLKSLFVLIHDARHLTTSSFRYSLEESDEQLRLYTQDELGQEAWERMRGPIFLEDGYFADKAREWKAWGYLLSSANRFMTRKGRCRDVLNYQLGYNK